MRTLLATLLIAAGWIARGASAQAPDYNRDIRPILAEHCLKCHGPDEKQRAAGLRLDVAASALAKQAIVPGKPEKSALVRRITATGALQMPPVTANKPLSPEKIKRLTAWVKSGAVYKPHWAFVKPVQAPPPGLKSPTPPLAIDAFVRARLAKAGLKPMPEADRYTLARRASLDLIGLPPTPEEADAFVTDTRPGAYERYVDRLLASPHYGERWARRWLDLARYADTNGYEKDRPRTMWLWRDWVIDSLNADKPYDTFTIEQIAGDLLPGATISQKIATGFHRNTMLNEEGGIDPLEYRFYAVVDRVATTGTTWLGLTLGCAQCHTHKYDPIPQKDYYRLMAFLDNADEPQIDVLTPEIARRRAETEAEAGKREAMLPFAWPVATPLKWSPTVAVPTAAGAASKAMVATAADGTVEVTGENPDKDTLTVRLPAGAAPVAALRLEAIAGAAGPGRTAHGNFVVTDLSVQIDGKPVKLNRAEADFAQDGFPPSAAIDGDPNRTGWAISGSGTWRVDRTATFWLETPTAGKDVTVTLKQNYGGQHTLGRFRLRLAESEPDTDPRPIDVRRRAAFDAAFAAWVKAGEADALAWTVVRPTRATSGVPKLDILPDRSILARGDQTKRDVYAVRLDGLPRGVTGIRIEALADPRLPRNGPGRVFYEGSPGDFRLSELSVGGAKLARAAATYGDAKAAIDGSPQTWWTIDGAQGKDAAAVFAFDTPLTETTLDLQMVFEMYYPAGLGRFRVSVTTDPRVGMRSLSPAVEAALATPAAARDAGMVAALRQAFCRTAPELASARAQIDALRSSVPAPTTALVFAERPADLPRVTRLYKRGEFLQPQEAVSPATLSALGPLPAGAPTNRLGFARWLVSKDNPLTARVAVNRAWAAFFGRGIVRTTEDFGYQGEPPTHPELLDWLAVEFMRRGWSQKQLHRWIVLSQTYRQSSRRTAQAGAIDPENRLLSRGPRVRLEAEQLRDASLAASGLLSHKRGGPSVFPPQPASVTTEGAYGALAWTVSAGEDRYRRGLYTFAKRTAPYAMFQTFDGGSGEACLARRETSNTPLQALTLLNDPVFVETAQALAKRALAHAGDADARLVYLFRCAVTRPPTTEETALLRTFLEKQRARLAKGEIDAKALCGEADNERAAWTTLARTVLNLDECIVKR